MSTETVNLVENISGTSTHIAGLRESDRDRVVDMFEKGHRLITITGLGGIGKSALAVDVVAALLKTRPELACSTLVLGETEGASIRTRLTDELGVSVDHLADDAATDPVSARLAIIEGGEYLGDSAAELEEILQALPGLHLLITSRVPLGLASEVTVQLRGLDTAADGDGVRLFRELAKDLGVRIPSSSRARVRDIVGRLGGYPLAIRLCAAQLVTMSIPAIHQAMVTPDSSGTESGAAETLNQVIGWSLERQSVNAVNLLKQLSVLGGWSTLDSIEGVAAIAEQVSGRSNGRPVSRTLWLSELVEAGLVDAEPAPLLGTETQMYRVHDSIRDVARQFQGVEAAPQETLLAAHHEWYSSRVADLAAATTTRRERQAFEQLQAELTAYIGALDSMLDVDPADVLNIATQLGEFWVTRGRMRSGTRLLRRGLEQIGEDPDGFGDGSLTAVLAQSWLAQMKLRERAPLATKTYHAWLTRHLHPVIDGPQRATVEHFALAVHFIYLSLASRSYPAALRVAAHCRDLAIDAGDDYHAGLFCFYLARVSEQADDQEEAVGHIRRAIEHVRRTQNESFLAKCVSQEVLLRQHTLTPVELVKELAPLPAIHLRNRNFKDAALITTPLAIAHFHSGNDLRGLELLRQNLALSRQIHYFEGQLWAVTLIAFADLSPESTPENIARAARLYGGFKPYMKRFEAVTAGHYQEMLNGAIEGLRLALGPTLLDQITSQSPTSWPQVMAEADAFAADLHAPLAEAAAAAEPDPGTRLDAALADLNERERALLDLVLTGLMDKQIAERLDLKPNTVRSYNSRVFRKLGVSSRTELLALFRGREL